MREAIVMAAGEGRRLRPLTERFAKPVLPVDGRAVIATLLRELAEAEVERATVVVGHLAEQIKALVGDGSGFGLEVRTARQARADGSADAVRTALAAGAGVPAIVTVADTVFARGDLAAFAERATVAGAAGALAVRPGEPSPHRPGVRIEDGLVRAIYDLDPGLPLTAAPLWALGAELVPFLDDLPGPPFELKDAFQRGIDSGHAVAAVEIGETRDLTDPVDLVVENFPYLSGVT